MLVFFTAVDLLLFKYLTRKIRLNRLTIFVLILLISCITLLFTLEITSRIKQFFSLWFFSFGIIFFYLVLSLFIKMTKHPIIHLLNFMRDYVVFIMFYGFQIYVIIKDLGPL